MSQRVAIVVPRYKNELTSNETLSLKHLEHYLGGYDKFFVSPEYMRTERQGFGSKTFGSEFFESVQSYSRLLLSRPFYEAFTVYDYILIYQLDALVFDSDLDVWCRQSLDYIGAPWFKIKDNPHAGLSRCGNGGLSLRRVEGFLRVLDSNRYVDKPVSYFSDFLKAPLPDTDCLGILDKIRKRLRVFREVRRGVQWYTGHYSINEDHFWSDRAHVFYPGFEVASVSIGLDFAFERYPNYCFEQNGYQLPFGCHAWAKWDQGFWKPYLLKG